MTITPQKKGKAHIDYIKEIAIAYWAKINWLTGMYPQCLRDAMKEHREYLIECENEQRKIAREQIQSRMKCRECFTMLEEVDIFHFGNLCRDCFQAKMNGEFRRDTSHVSLPPRIVKPRLTTGPLI